MMEDVNGLSTYEEEVVQYVKKDTIHALLFLAIILLLNIIRNVFPSLHGGFHATLIIHSIQLVALFVLLMKKGQGLRSVGIHLANWKKALAVGLVFAAVNLILFNGVLSGVLGGWQLRGIVAIIGTVASLLFLAFYEDVFFFGYFQTRIYGLVKKDWLAVFVVALLFAVMHWPSWLVAAITGEHQWFGDYSWGMFAFHNISWIMFHIFVNTIFRHLRSIITVTLFHFSMNLAMGAREGLWQLDSYEIGSTSFISFGIVYGFIMFVIWWISPQRKNKR